MAWEVLSVENSEGEGQLNLGVTGWFNIIGSSTVGYSEYSGYVSSGYSLSGCYLTVESLMKCEPSHTKIYMLGSSESSPGRALYTPPPIPTGLLLDSRNPTGLD